MNRDTPDDTRVLEQATQALRDVPVPPGPPDEVLAIVGALDGQVLSSGLTPSDQIKTRIFTMKRILSIAAAVLVMAAAGGLMVHLLSRSAGVAFADVRRQIEQVQTIKWHMSMQMLIPGPTGVVEFDCYYKEPGLMRQEFIAADTGDKGVNTMNYQTGKMLSLTPSGKQAIIIDMGQVPPSARQSGQNIVSQMKKMVQGNGIELGTRQINGQRAKGFRIINKNGQTMDIWVDPKTGAPITMEMTLPGVGAMTMGQFVLDEEMDDSLFSLTPPAGYKLSNLEMPMGDLSENDLIAGLRYLAEVNDNMFPPTLAPTEKMRQALAEREKDYEGKKGMGQMNRMIRMMLFTQLAKDFRYVGADVALGDAGRIICRFKVTEGLKCGGAGPYRVVYGDLRIEDAATDETPSTSPAEEP